MFLHVNPSSILPPIIFLLNLQYFIQVDLGQPFSLLWLQPQSKSNGGIMMCKGQYLHNQCEFIDAPPEGFILKDVDDYFRGDLPWCVAHRSIQCQDLLQFLWKGTLGQPLQLSSRSEETLQVTGHYVHASFFSSCAESQEVSDLDVYLIAVQECLLDGQMLLQVGWVKHQKSLKMGDVAVGVEEGIQRGVDGFGDRWHEEHPMRLLLLHTMVTLQLEEALIPIQSRHPRLLQLRVPLQLKHRVTLHQLWDMAAMHEVDDCGSMQGRGIVAGELLNVVGDLLEGQVGLGLGDLLGVVVGVVGLFAR